MKWDIRHRTAYRYASAVRDSFNQARVRPPSNRQQRLESFHLTVNPPAQVCQYSDCYGNCVDQFNVAAPHTALELETRAVVTTFAPDWLAVDTRPATLEQARQAGQSEPCFDFAQASRFTDTSPETRRAAEEAAQGENDAWQAALAIMRFVNDRMSYEPLTTHVHTHAREALAEGRGVCQDFAHVMIGMCRTLKIPARYVSGYLYNEPAGDLAGSQASHAWCEVYLPGIGWRGLDPTNGRQADERHVKIGVGRDYADIAPLKGHYRGTSAEKMKVEVSVAPAE